MPHPMPINRFKQQLRERAQIGLWVAMGDAYAAEIAATAGFDWLLLDGEHAPNDLRSTLAQLQAVAPFTRSHPIVRPPIGDAVLIKQLLDIGAQTLLVPMVEDALQARELVRATRYPPHGVRGIGAALARASHWSLVENYLEEADAQICLLVQVETAKGLAELDAIAAEPGVDGVFIGPNDLAASLGHPGQLQHPEVLTAIDDAITRIQHAGKAAGILATDPAQARHYIERGCAFVAVGVDTIVLARSLSQLAAQFRD